MRFGALVVMGRKTKIQDWRRAKGERGGERKGGSGKGEERGGGGRREGILVENDEMRRHNRHN